MRGSSKPETQTCLAVVATLAGALLIFRSATFAAQVLAGEDLYRIALLLAVAASIVFVSLLWYAPAAALAVFILSLPILSRLKQIVFVDLSYFFVSAESVLIVALALATLPRVKSKTRLPLSRKFKVCLGCFLLFALLATFSASRPAVSTSALLEGYLLPCLLFLSALWHVRTLKQFERVVWALIGAAAIASGYGLYQSFNYGGDYRIVSVYYNPNILAVVLVSTIPLPAAAAVYHRNIWLRAIAIAVFAENCLALVLTEARGAVIALAIGLVGMLFLPRGSKIHFAVGAVLAVTLLLPFRAEVREALSNRPVFGLSLQLKTSTSERWLGAQSSLAMIRDHPLGIGPGMFVYHYPDYKLPEAAQYLEDAHNLFLNIFVEGGIGAGLFFLWMFVESLRKSFASLRRKRSPIHPFAVAIFVSLLVFGIASLTTGEQFLHRHMANVAYSFWMLAALAMILAYRGRSFEDRVFKTAPVFSASGAHGRQREAQQVACAAASVEP